MPKVWFYLIQEKNSSPSFLLLFNKLSVKNKLQIFFICLHNFGLQCSDLVGFFGPENRECVTRYIITNVACLIVQYVRMYI